MIVHSECIFLRGGLSQEQHAFNFLRYRIKINENCSQTGKVFKEKRFIILKYLNSCNAKEV